MSWKPVTCCLWVLLVIGCDRGTARPEICGDFDPETSKIPDAWLACATDDDCVRAHQGCCGCSGGSNGIAVNQAYATCVKPQCPEAVNCPTVEACRNDLVCNDGMCGLSDPPPEAPTPPPQPPRRPPVDDTLDCAGYVAGSIEVPESLRTCASDDDCVLAQRTCCPCSGNGDRLAVAKAFAGCITPPPECQYPPVCGASYRCDRHEAVCMDKLCTRVDAEPPGAQIDELD